MIRSLLKLLIAIVIGILIYNYFFGDTAEKEQSKKIFGETKALFRSVTDLVKDEKTKFDDGKYDKALTKIENIYDDLSAKAKSINDSGLLDKVSDLERKRVEIRERLDQLNEQTNAPAPTKRSAKAAKDAEIAADKKAISEDLERLMQETQTVLEDLK